MAQVHVVMEGEHLSAIALKHGFRSFIPIWNASENAKLRAVREDPHQLLPGDEVVVPDKQPAKPFVRKPGASYKFVVYVEKLKLRLEVVGLDGAPSVGTTGTLTINGIAGDVTTDGDGVITAAVPSDCTSATLQLGEAQYEIAVGALAPISESAGMAGRFTNLGYWYGDDDDANDTEALALAVELFQADHGLDITGNVDADIIQQLDQAHDGRE